MEGFEHVVKVALETENLIVSSNLKFPVKRQTKNGRIQEHGYEIDLVGARHDRLVLASVKSFFGSKGVNRQGFETLADSKKRKHLGRFTLFNDPKIQKGIVTKAAARFGYSEDKVEVRLYVGKFFEKDKADIIQHVHNNSFGCWKIKVIDLNEIVAVLFKVLENKTYFNDPVVMTLKALEKAKLLRNIQGNHLADNQDD